MKDPILEVNNLRVSFRTYNGKVQAVRGIDFKLFEGETLAIVGESGSGKSVTTKAILGILPKNSIIEEGEILYKGDDLTKYKEKDFYKIRGKEISLIFQDPLSALNPIMKIGKQITEALVLREHMTKEQAKKRAIELMGKPASELKIVVCHLGNGSSLSAAADGKCQDTSMGLSPLAGVPMGTRAGDLDAGILEYLMGKHGYDMKEMMTILNKKSGVLGVSGVSSDFRALDAAAAEGNDRAQLALDMFHYWVAKVVGSYVAAMNGVDAIIFTAGVGENSKSSRAAIAKYFGYLGVTIDPEANSKRGEDIMISTPDSKVKVFVIPTNEELVIARDTKAICG